MDYIDYLIYLEDLPPELKFPIYLGVWIITLATIILFLFKIFGGNSETVLDNSQSEEEIRHDVRKFLQQDGIDEFSLLERRKTPPRGRANLLYLKTCPAISIEGIEDEKLQNLIQHVDSAFDQWEKEDALIDQSSKIFRDIGEHMVQSQVKRDKGISSRRRYNLTTSSVLEQSPIFKKSEMNSKESIGNILDEMKDTSDDIDDENEGEEGSEEDSGLKLSLGENEEFVIEGLDDDNLDFDNNFLGEGALVLPTEKFDNLTKRDEGDENGGTDFPKFDIPSFPQNLNNSNDDEEDEDEEEDDPFANIDIKGFEERTKSNSFSADQKEFLKEVYSEFATGTAQ